MSMTMSGRSFSYHRLKKLPPAAAAPHTTTTTTGTTLEQDHDPHQHQPPSPSTAAAIQESYRSYYRALGASLSRGGRRQQGPATARAWRRRRPRLRISRLARALRRRAAALGGSVRASVARVARRLLKEGRPYIGDLFAGNYMFLQVAPSPTTAVLDAKGAGSGRFADYYYAVVARSKTPPAGVGAAAAPAGVLYKV